MIRFQYERLTLPHPYRIFAAERNGKLIRVGFPDLHPMRGEEKFARWFPNEPVAEKTSPVLNLFFAQVREYFRGERRAFDVPFEIVGTAFQRRVLNRLLKIPYGATTTYGGIAKKLGKPGTAIAVGQAVAKNPLSILIPCHRVVGSDGSLTGYAFGLDLKRALLDLEGRSLK